MSFLDLTQIKQATTFPLRYLARALSLAQSYCYTDTRVLTPMGLSNSSCSMAEMFSSWSFTLKQIHLLVLKATFGLRNRTVAYDSWLLMNLCYTKLKRNYKRAVQSGKQVKGFKIFLRFIRVHKMRQSSSEPNR